MLRILMILTGLCILPMVTTLFLKVVDRQIALWTGYVSGVVLHVTIFSLCVRYRYQNALSPGLMPVKAVFGTIAFEAIAAIGVALMKYGRKKRKGNISALFRLKINALRSVKANEWIGIFAACAVWMMGAVSYLRYVPDGAVTMMADINRLDYFGVTNSDPTVMLGYYLKKLFGVSQADAVCLIIPLSFYVPFVILMWGMAETLFPRTMSQADMAACSFGEWRVDHRMKRCLCFGFEAILTVAGACRFTQPYLVLYGLNHVENCLLALCVPFAFAVGLHFLLLQPEDEKKKVGLTPGYCIAIAVCVISSYLLEPRAFALVGLNAVIFAVLFAGRRYLP